MDTEHIEIKVEDEMGIFVKEEETFIEGTTYDDDKYDEDTSKSEYLLVESHPELFGKELLVYTTKVDDVWTKNYKYPRNVLSVIENKTKPVFNGKLIKKKRRKYTIKFNRFIHILEDYNRDIRRYKNKQLFFDCKKNKKSVIANLEQRKHGTIQTIVVNDDSDEPLSQTNTNDKVDLVHADNSSNIAGKSGKKTLYYTIVMHTIRLLQDMSFPCRLYDVYIMNKDGMPQEFYQVDKTCLSSISAHTKKNISTKINNCCWYKREQKIKQMTQEPCTKFKSFLRISHTCEAKQCICCCKRKYVTSDNTKHIPENTKPIPENAKPIEQNQRKDYFQNRWHKGLLKTPVTNRSSVINVALASRPNKKINKKHRRKGHYLDTHLSLKIGGTQQFDYYIDENGLVNTLVKTFDCPESIATNHCKAMIDINKSQAVNVVEDICCADKYNKYLLKLVKLGESNLAKFINTCGISLERCDICKNVESQNSIGAKSVALDISLPKYPKHVLNYTKKKKVRPYVMFKNNKKIPISKTETVDLEKLNKNDNLNSIGSDIADIQLVIAPGGCVKIQTKSNPERISTENLIMLKEIINYTSHKIASLNLNINQTINIRDLIPKTPLTHTSYIKTATTNVAQQKDTNGSIPKYLTNIEKIATDTQLRQIIHHNIKDITDTKTTATAVIQPQHTKKSITKETSENNNETLIDDIEIIVNLNNLQPVSSISNISTGAAELVENIYQNFTIISAQKRKQYLISHAFITNTTPDLWTNVKNLQPQIYVNRNVVTTTHMQKENIKRRTIDKCTSPPPKKMGRADSDETIAKHNIVVSMPSTSGVILRNALLTPSFQPDNIEDLSSMNTNVTRTVPNNMTVIPICQLPQELVTSLYSQYAMLPFQHNEDTIPIPGPINMTERVSLLPTLTQMPNTIIPVVLPSNDTVIKTENVDIEVNKDDDCILGV